eukprot:TRINITY_DN6232_c0_g1_i1.p1 TRINITY_DN6232_c0_g1~~TRINITY_DN6232_c0_g1_i1.p1  ORF type:complete len:168 (+),score=52.88 TRINITY_DN6232_c0_g1_i1:38-541(+)
MHRFLTCASALSRPALRAPAAQSMSRSSVRCYAKVKTETGFAGVEVVPDARERLVEVYTQTLEAIKAVPADAAYRKAVEGLTKHRLQVTRTARELADIEEAFEGQQVEELLILAQEELALIPRMVEYKPWVVDADHKEVQIIHKNYFDSGPSIQLEPKPEPEPAAAK